MGTNDGPTYRSVDNYSIRVLNLFSKELDDIAHRASVLVSILLPNNKLIDIHYTNRRNKMFSAVLFATIQS